MSKKSKQQATTIVVANNKGGVGKTTTAVHLAVGLAAKLRSSAAQSGRGAQAVAIVDLDPQGHAGGYLGMRSQIYHEVENSGGPCISFLLDAQRGVPDVTLHVRDNLYLIPSSPRIARATQTLAEIEAKRRESPALFRGIVPIEHVLEDRLADLLDVCRYVVIDCPPNLGVLETAAYNVGDHVVVPVAADSGAADGLRLHTEALARMKETQGVKARLSAIVPTFARTYIKEDRGVIEQIGREYAGVTTVCEPVPLLTIVKQAMRSASTVFEMEPRSPASQAYFKLVNHVAALPRTA